jgi:hypothetical protein
MNSLKEKAIYIILSLTLLFTMVTLFVLMNSSMSPSFSETIVVDSTPLEEPIVEEEFSTLLENRNRALLLEGAVVMLAEDFSYVRLSVANEGIFSVGINEDTIIAQSNEIMTLKDLAPLSEVVVEAVPLEDSQMYDFLALSLSVKKGREMTPEEHRLRTEERVELLDI